VPCHRINDLGCPSGMGRQQYADGPRCKPVCLSPPNSAGIFELGKPFGAVIVHSVDSESRPTGSSVQHGIDSSCFANCGTSPTCECTCPTPIRNHQPLLASSQHNRTDSTVTGSGVALGPSVIAPFSPK
jgi:hypothetical protein